MSRNAGKPYTYGLNGPLGAFFSVLTAILFIGLVTLQAGMMLGFDMGYRSKGKPADPTLAFAILTPVTAVFAWTLTRYTWRTLNDVFTLSDTEFTLRRRLTKEVIRIRIDRTFTLVTSGSLEGRRIAVTGEGGTAFFTSHLYGALELEDRLREIGYCRAITA